MKNYFFDVPEHLGTMPKRLCSYCNKEKPLNKGHFQVIKMFKQGYSFCCLTCNERNKNPKTKKKDQKFLNEKLEVKIQHRDLEELVSILGYYKGMVESSDEHEVSTTNINRILDKIKHELDKHS